MARIVSTMDLKKALDLEGYELPADCRDVELLAEPGSAFRLRYTCFINNENLEKLGRALAQPPSLGGMR